MLLILVTTLTWSIGQILRDETTRTVFSRMPLSSLLLLLIPAALDRYRADIDRLAALLLLN